jgi:Methyltransferase domain
MHCINACCINCYRKGCRLFIAKQEKDFGMKCVMCKGGLTLIDKIPSKAVVDKYFSEYGIDLPILDCSPLLNEILYYQCEKCSLFQYDKSWIGNGKFYEALQEKDWYYLENKSEFLIAYKYINDNDSVCEIGCGNGKFATGIPAYVEYKGYELNLKALSQARKKGLNVVDEDFINNSHAEKSSYDICAAFQVLEHVDFYQQWLKRQKKEG